MNTQERLKKIGGQLLIVDKHFVHLMARRIELACEVAKAKHAVGQPIVRREIEDARLEQARTWAKQWGLNPQFAASLLYNIIGESCKEQIELIDAWHNKTAQCHDANTEESLKRNLLDLTEKCAAGYNQRYGADRFSTTIHALFEHELIARHLEGSPGDGNLVDIGCATGRELFQHSKGYKSRIGIDISPAMIAVARAGAAERKISNVRFEVADAEQGLPILADASATLVYMNQGAASDLKHIKKVLNELERVLVPEGRFVCSFYNQDALVYQTFLPWPVSLAAEIDEQEHCLRVVYDGEIYPIFAKTYSVEEAKALFSHSLHVTEVSTHPAISSVLPNDVLEEQKVRALVTQVDRDLAFSQNEAGAYITIAGVKK